MSPDRQSRGAARVLRTRELNRAMLSRQLLLRRVRSTLPRTLERMAGLQAQYAPSMYIGLWSRLEGFERAHLTTALEHASVVQGTLMRTTIHLVSAGDYWPFATGIGDARRRSWLRAQRPPLDPDELDSAAARLRAELQRGPLKRKEIDDLIGPRMRAAAVIWLDLVRVPPSGTWERRRADIYADAERWLRPVRTSASEGVELLVKRYLGGFGPAAPKDIANWAGLPLATIRPVLERLRLRRFVTGKGEELLDLLRAPLPDPDTPAPARFLPTWDAVLLAHARRAGILAEEYRPLIFNTRMPQSLATFLVDGSVAGLWRYERGGVRLEPFKPLSRAARRELEEEGERLSAFHA
jgi:hypothetical protein